MIDDVEAMLKSADRQVLVIGLRTLRTLGKSAVVYKQQIQEFAKSSDDTISKLAKDILNAIE
jgi:hypothetical protein